MTIVIKLNPATDKDIIQQYCNYKRWEYINQIAAIRYYYFYLGV